MRVLLDTHVWLWMYAEPERLNKRALKLLHKPDNDLVLSSASTWEISIKHSIGRIELDGPIARMIPEMMQQTQVTALSITHAHTVAAGSLPRHHADPFDRMLIAQARLEGLTLLSADKLFENYDVELIAAA